MLIQTINPATEEVIADYSPISKEKAGILITKASVRYDLWRKTSFLLRQKLMFQLADNLRRRKLEFARLMASEMGKPIALGQDEIEKCAWLCEHYGKYTEQYLSDQLVDTHWEKSLVCYQPLGIILGIMPWNYPFWQVFRFAVPAIMAGNVVVLKHASVTLGSGNAIERLFLDVGFPEFVFQHLIMDKSTVSSIISDPHIVGVTLTGSDEAGRSVAMQAGANLKKVMLELGGSDPYLILEDADLKLAARSVVASRLNNSGQVCIAAKRVIVSQSVIRPFIKHVREEMDRYTMADPQDPETKLGPLARSDLRTKLQEQIDASLVKGAKLQIGGEMPNTKGFYYPPTLLTQVSPGMPAFDEELFGPVIALIEAPDELTAIRLANRTSYGLGAAIFTQNKERGEQIAKEELQAGSCFVNAKVVSDPRLPFGGIKQSGFGRELSREGILEFVNTKTVVIGA